TPHVTRTAPLPRSRRELMAPVPKVLTTETEARRTGAGSGATARPRVGPGRVMRTRASGRGALQPAFKEASSTSPVTAPNTARPRDRHTARDLGKAPVARGSCGNNRR